jgi:hypothetical protein
LEGKKNFSEEDFHEVVTGYVFLLMSTTSTGSAVCKNVIQSITTSPPTFYSRIQSKYGASLDKESIEHILEDVNKTIGHELTGTEVSFMSFPFF